MRIIPVLSWLFVSILVLSALSLAAESDMDRLLYLLSEKGVVTKEEAAGFRADLAIKKQEEKEKQKEFSVITGKPIKISGYTQSRYRQDESINDTFDIRRARLTFKGNITERFSYKLQHEFGGSSQKLLDAELGYEFNPHFKLSAGQFKIPFSQENLTSSAKLDTINRSQVVEALTARSKDVLGNQSGRDIGIKASGSFWQVSDIFIFDYELGVFNGSGINTSNRNEHKDFIGRLIFHPINGLSVGASYYSGRYTLPTAPTRKDDRDRIGVEFAYVHEPISLKGEYIKGNDGVTKKNEWYLQAGYFFIPKKLQGILKYDTYDPNKKASKDAIDVYTIGANWFFNKWAKLQVNYELKDEEGKEKKTMPYLPNCSWAFRKT